jgi:hypothetical protein
VIARWITALSAACLFAALPAVAKDAGKATDAPTHQNKNSQATKQPSKQPPKPALAAASEACETGLPAHATKDSLFVATLLVVLIGRWLGGMSISQAWCGSTEAKKVILELSAGADVVWVEHLRGAGMLPSALSCPVIWDAVDALGPLFTGRAGLVQNPLKSWVFNCEATRTGREEALLAARFSATIAVTEREAALLGPNVTAIQNGVDCDYFQPHSAGMEAAGYSGFDPGGFLPPPQA